MANFIIAAALIVLIGCALVYIIKEKKNGRKCIGCPHSGGCNAKCSCDSKK